MTRTYRSTRMTKRTHSRKPRTLDTNYDPNWWNWEDRESNHDWSDSLHLKEVLNDRTPLSELTTND